MKESIKRYILKEIDDLLEKNDKLLMAIDGMSASGKSSFSKLLSEEYDCNVFHMDDFFLPSKFKTQQRLEEVGGNVDYMRFKEDVMERLKGDKTFNYQIFDCKMQTLTEYRTVVPKKLNIIEGVYSMHPELIDYYDLKVFFEIDDDTQKERILDRNGNEMYKKFRDIWIPLENKYFKELNIIKKSDNIID
ncbi:uridine kinase family protein [Senegalia sp. (in: firmicutes)]|uniref:uridine kinase family protein n=1 Tax=Senegalia sp. (in: firmicutes) TaxID=1924098 RepID=UPI003F98BFAD